MSMQSLQMSGLDGVLGLLNVLVTAAKAAAATFMMLGLPGSTSLQLDGAVGIPSCTVLPKLLRKGFQHEVSQ